MGNGFQKELRQQDGWHEGLTEMDMSGNHEKSNKSHAEDMGEKKQQ